MSDDTAAKAATETAPTARASQNHHGPAPTCSEPLEWAGADLTEADLLRALERAEARNGVLQHQLSAHERALNDMLLSTSWRITAPLRMAGTWLRRMRRGAGTADETVPRMEPAQYEKWVSIYSTVTPEIRATLTKRLKTLPSRPLISIVMPSYNIDLKWMTAAIDSVIQQIYPKWELCISDDASTVEGIRDLLKTYAAQDARIKIAFRETNGHICANSNSALDLATGDYVALMDADDCLTEDALFWVAQEIAHHPEVDLLFSDEDKLDESGTRCDPYFKSAWNPSLMLAQNAFSHLGVYRRSLVEKVGRFREGFEGAQDHDLVLRCAAHTTAERIRHIPRVLYHWRITAQSTASGAESKPYAWKAGQKAIVDYLAGQRLPAQVDATLNGYYQVIYDTPQPQPLVSILMATTLGSPFTVECVRSILEKTTYGTFELLIMIKKEHLAAAQDNSDVAGLLADPRVRLVPYEADAFNYSRVNNLGAAHANGDYFCLINDDIEVITRDWLQPLVARAQIDGVGGVGPMLYYPSGRIQHAGVILGIGGVADHAFRNIERGSFGYFGRATLEQDYSALTAACLIIPRAVFESVGGFDEDLPVAFNDVDLSIRIRQSGRRLIWTPTVEMYHHESLTFGVHSAPARARQFENDVMVMRLRWSDALDTDPYHNPNLSLDPAHPFAFAFPPRVSSPTAGSPEAAQTAIYSRTSALTTASSRLDSRGPVQT